MRNSITTPRAPKPVGPYSQAIRANGVLFVAGQVGIDPHTQAVVPGGIAAQTERAIANIGAILEAAGSDLTRVVRCVVYLRTMDDFVAMNATYARHFSDPAPARTTVGVSELPKHGLVEIEATALARARR
jgi:2-iminobutanoate/2-iminopropanoate deaminase